MPIDSCINYRFRIFPIDQSAHVMRLIDRGAKEYRYKLIIDLFKEGKDQATIAQTVQCVQSNVSYRLSCYHQKGSEALQVGTRNNGRPCGLSATQLEKLPILLQQGALQHGFPTDNWTQRRIVELIEKNFGVRYSPSHISRLMKRIGFTSQKPERHSYRQDPEQVKEWREQTLPELKKKR